MRAIIIFFLQTLITATVVTAQAPAPKFSKYPVGDSGVQIYFPSLPEPVDISYSPDSSKVYTMESLDLSTGPSFYFGAIVVKLKYKISGTGEEDLLTGYLDYLKQEFEIDSSAGYRKGHSLKSHRSANGIIDYWKDSDKNEWSVTAWIAENTIVVMYISGPKEYPNRKVKDAFMKGVRFHGD